MSKLVSNSKPVERVAFTVKGRYVEFLLKDVKAVCEVLGFTYRKNISDSKKADVLDKLIANEVSPYMVKHENGSACYGNAAEFVYFRNIIGEEQPLTKEEVTEIEDRVASMIDTSDDVIEQQEEVATVEEPVVVSQAKRVTVDVELTQTILSEIVTYATQSRYNNIPDYRLYSRLRLSAAQCRDSLNALYKQGMITVKTVGTYKLIAHTPKATRTVSKKVVSKETCLKVFKAIAKYEYENTKYLNVSYVTLERTVGLQVGVITLDCALQSLMDAGYIESKVVGYTTVYTSTKLGRGRLQAIS